MLTLYLRNECEIWVIYLDLSTRSTISAAEIPVKFQSDTIIMIYPVSRFWDLARFGKVPVKFQSDAIIMIYIQSRGFENSWDLAVRGLTAN